MTLLDVRHVTKRFGDAEILRDISFSVMAREFITVVGPSGCGKSTLVRMLAGLEPVSDGEILIDGKPVSGPGTDRGMVFQKYTLFPWMTVKQNVMFGLSLNGSGRASAEGQALQWIEMIGLSRFTDHFPHQLSGGMQQRVAIARSLATGPRVLLMDEPFGALDPRTRQKMQKNLVEIWQNIDITIVFITHDLDEALYLGDRLVLMQPNPGELQRILTVDIPRPRDRAVIESPRFIALKNELDALMHHDENEDTDEIDIPLQMIRMAPPHQR